MKQAILWLRQKLGVDNQLDNVKMAQPVSRQGVDHQGLHQDQSQQPERQLYFLPNRVLKQAIENVTEEAVTATLRRMENNLTESNSLTYLCNLHMMGKLGNTEKIDGIFSNHKIKILQPRPKSFRDLPEKIHYEFLDIYTKYLETMLGRVEQSRLLFNQKVDCQVYVKEVLKGTYDFSLIKHAAQLLRLSEEVGSVHQAHPKLRQTRPLLLPRRREEEPHRGHLRGPVIHRSEISL